MKIHYLANETCVMKDCDQLATKEGFCSPDYERYAYNRLERAARSASRGFGILVQLIASRSTKWTA